MGWLDTILGRLEPVMLEEPTNGNSKAVAEPDEQKALILSPRSFWLEGSWANRNPDRDTVDAMTAYATVALAYLCIKYRARKLSEPPLMVVEETDDGEEWIPHDLDPLLARPNPDYAMRRMQELTSIYRDTTGSCLWLKIRDRGQTVARLYPFPGDSFTVEATDDRLYGMFRIETRNRGKVDALAEDVIYFQNLNPEDLMTGLAPIDVALNWLDLDTKLRVSIRSALRNAVLPSGILSTKEILGDNEWKRAFGELERWHGGPRNVGKPMLADGGAQWQTIAMSLADLMPGELWDRIEAVVCSVFAVRPEVLGVLVGLKNAPWSHMEMAQRMGYEEMAVPQWSADAEILTESLLRPMDGDPSHLIRFDTSGIPALQENIAEKAAIAAQGSGYLTVDEKRQLLGYAPVGGSAGETILVPLTMQPLEFLVNAANGDPNAEPLPEVQPELEPEFAE